jgi:protein TonB
MPKGLSPIRYQKPKSSRALNLGLVLLLHAVIIAALIGGLSHSNNTSTPALVATELLASPQTKTVSTATTSTEMPTETPAPTTTPITPVTPATMTTTTAAINSTETLTTPAANKSVFIPVNTDIRSGCRKPDYPTQAQENREEGAVTLELRIDAHGAVSSARVKQSSGFRSLDRAAVQALKECVFKPATQDGQAIESLANLTYIWKLT